MRICVPVVAQTVQGVLDAVSRARGSADLIELRLDCLKNPAAEDLQRLFSGVRIPFIATNRPAREGGSFKGPERQRLAMLEKAIGKAAFIDVELSAPQELRRKLSKNSKRTKTRIIVSFHDTRATPAVSVLEKNLDAEMKAGADVAKIVTTARFPEDNIKFVELYEYAKARRVPLVAWAMGEAGRPSRFLAMEMDAPIVFASLKGTKSAPGQLSVKEARKFLRAKKGK